MLRFYEKPKIWVWMNNLSETDVKKNRTNTGHLNWSRSEKVLSSRIAKSKLNQLFKPRRGCL